MASRAAAVNSPLPVPSGPVDLWIFNLCLFIMLRFRLLTTSWSMDDAGPPVSSSSLSSDLRSIGKGIKVLLGPALPGRVMNLLAEMPPPTHHPDLQHSHQQLVQLCRQLLWRWVNRLPGPFPLHQGPSDFSSSGRICGTPTREGRRIIGGLLWKCCSRGCFSVPSGAAAGGGQHNVN